jgi:cytochrome c biogenesis protein CcmG/thiol:disulfide interchange protein DsbE
LKFQKLGVLGIGLIIGLVLGATILLGSPTSQRVQAPPTIGKPIPEFNLILRSGENITNKSILGKPVIINFWASWCPPCREEMPLLEKIYQENKDKIILVGINLDDSEATVDEYLDEYQLTFPVGIDQSGKVSTIFYARSLPVTFFFDREGIMRAQHLGMLTESLTAKYLATIGINP